MKNKLVFTRFFVYFFWLATFLVGCLSNQNATSSSPDIETLQASDTLMPSMIASSSTTKPYITATNPGETASPALETNDAYLLLKEYLKNDPPCQLPCWGGITPGKSNLSDAQNQLEDLRGISDRVYFGKANDSWSVGTLTLVLPLKNVVVGIRAGYVAPSDSETVILNGFIASLQPKQSSREPVYDFKEYNDLLSAYTMPEIFNTYGLPNSIYTRAVFYPDELGASDFFIIRLLYMDRGVFISYTMPMKAAENKFKLCPSESLIDLELTSSNVGNNYQEFFRQVGVVEWASVDESNHKQLEDALGLTNEEFSQAVISSPDACFETPIEIWPDS